jgi:hypothetical protein
MIFLLAIPSSINIEPPRNIPAQLYEDYTLGNLIPVHEWYLDDSSQKSVIFTIEEVNRFIYKAAQRHNNYYGPTDGYLYAMLDKYADSIKEKKVAIIGSNTPWYESVVLSYGGYPVTIEYNKIFNEDLRIEVMTVDEYNQNPQVFDAVISISSIEHDGLGRYGDPINPQGDLETMSKIRTILKDEGLFFLSVPVGVDALYWNAHRIYGKLRLPLLLEHWEIIDFAGFSHSDLMTSNSVGHQPVFVLSNRSRSNRADDNQERP